VIAGNDLLARHAAQAGAREVRVIPTCLDPSRYEPKGDYRLGSPPRMVWIGSSSTLEQVARFADALNAMGRAIEGLVFRIIADATLALEDVRVEPVAWSLETEARLLAEADFAVAPLPDTPFTRGKCAFKVLQYLAAGLPVITSPVGVNAEYVADERTGLWARSPEQWASQASRLVGDASLRARLGQAGRAFVEQHMDVALWQDAFCDAVAFALRDAAVHL
jgi:glycosyltransferase involved in cell wall biosynthesis